MPSQLTFDEIRRARLTDPATSRESARRSHGLASEHCRAILAVMRRGGDWTAHEIAAQCGLTSVQVSRRMAQLRDDGAVVETVNTRPTPSGRPAQCYEANQ